MSDDWVSSPLELKSLPRDAAAALAAIVAPGLWHVTRSATRVRADGFRSRAETGVEGFGGGHGDHDPDTISVCCSLEDAQRYHRAMAFTVDVLRGRKSTEDCLRFLFDWYSVETEVLCEDDVVESLLHEYGICVWDHLLDEKTSAIALPGLAGAFGFRTSEEMFDLFMGLDRLLQDREANRSEKALLPRQFGLGITSTARDLGSARPEDVELLRLEVRKTARIIWHAPEMELRVPPGVLRIASFTP